MSRLPHHVRALVRSFVACSFLCLFCCGALWAQAPVIQVLSPPGVNPGSTAKVRVAGSQLAGATELWSTFGEKSKLAADIEKNGTDNGSCVFDVTVPADAPLGVHGVRVVTPQGVSVLRPILVDDLPTVPESGSHATFETAMPVPVPAAIDGTATNLARDYFRFEAQAGQTLTFEVWARRLGSPLDASLFLYRADGRELNFSDDAEGLSADPQLVHTFAEAGAYVLEIRDIQYAGGGTHFYRLRIGEFPAVHTAVPLAVKRGASTRVDFAGQYVADAAPAFADIPADYPHDWYPVSTKRPGGTGSAFWQVRVSDDVEFLEHEPNETFEQANRVETGFNLNGRFETPGDVDQFRFPAKKGEAIVCRGITREVGAPTDLVLRLVDAGGKQIARVDDTGTAEGTLKATIPADGEYLLEATDLHRRGGSAYAYRIDVQQSRSSFSLEANLDAISVPRGGVTPVTVTASRNGYGGPIELRAEGMPTGAQLGHAVIGPGQNSTVITLQGTEELAAGVMTPVRLVGTADIGGQSVTEVVTAAGSLRSAWSNATIVPPGLESEFAVAARPAEKVQLTFEPGEVVFGRELKATVKVVATRGEGLDEAITLATEPAKNALPGNISFAVKPIDKGKNEVVLEFSANEKAPLGTFTVVLSGTHKKGKETVQVYTPAIPFRLAEPFALTMPAASHTLKRGGVLKVSVAVKRNPAFAGNIKLTGSNLPAGVTLGEVIVPADQEMAELTLTATNEAAAGSVGNVRIEGVAVDNGKLKEGVALGTLVVE